MSDNKFYSMDKLIEFGMEISIANQMARSMNETSDKMDLCQEIRQIEL